MAEVDMVDRNNNSVDRRQLLKYVGLAGAAGLAGCVGTGDNPNSTETQDGGGESGATMASSIELWSSSNANAFELAENEYEEANSGVDIERTNMGRGDLESKLNSRLLSGTGAPDVVMVGQPSAPRFVDTGALRDLSGWIDEIGAREDIVDASWGGISRDGAVYGLPWDIGPAALFYRQDVFNEHGINPDDISTWDDLLEAGTNLPEDQNIYSLQQNEYGRIWALLYRQLGGQPITEDGKINVNSSDSVRVAEQMKRMYDSGVTAQTASWTSNWFNNFQTGDTASVGVGAWFSGTLQSNVSSTSGDWRLMKLPAFEEGGSRASIWGGSALMVPSQIDDSKAARATDFMELACTDEDIQKTLYQDYGIFPALQTTYDSDVYGEPVEFFGGQAVGELFTEIVPEASPWRYSSATPVIGEAMQTNLRALMEGDLGAQAAVDQAAQEIADRTERDIA